MYSSLFVLTMTGTVIVHSFMGGCIENFYHFTLCSLCTSNQFSVWGVCSPLVTSHVVTNLVRHNCAIHY